MMDELRTIIHDKVKSSLASLRETSPGAQPIKTQKIASPSSSDYEHLMDEATPSKQWEENDPLSEVEIVEDTKKFYFSAEEMGDLLKAVRATMGIEEAQKSHSIQEEMFWGLRTKRSKIFPINENIKEMVLDEWSNREKRLRKGDFPLPLWWPG